jgi:hypothetical protein
MTVSKKVIIFVLLVISLPSCRKNELQVWVASPWERVMRNTSPRDTQEVVISAGINEYEPFRIIIHNQGRMKAEGINVSLSDLEGNSGKIGAENFTLYRSNYIFIDKPSPGTTNPAGWYPDVLIPISSDVAINIDTLQNADIWCDIFVPGETNPGTYHGNVLVKTGKKAVCSIPVTLNVWDLVIPEKISMPSYFGGMEHAARILGVASGSGEFIEAEELFNRELLRHRAIPSTPGSVWPEWDVKNGIIDRGEGEKMKKLVSEYHFNSLDIPFRYREDPEKCRNYLSAMADWLRRLGYLDMAYVYMEDEPNNAKQYEIVRKQGALIKSADPGIGRLCTEQTITQDSSWGNLYGAVSIWCPLWGLWDEKTANERLAKGEKLWSYTALCQGSPETPWWEIDMDPVNFRSPMWISWNYNITGFLYWSSVYWGNAGTPEEVWKKPVYQNDGDFWGEGTLLYPGSPAGIKGFVPSIRLKLYREAEEDYEYIVMASGTGRTDEVKSIVAKVAQSFQKWSHDPEEYMAARKELARIITSVR